MKIMLTVIKKINLKTLASRNNCLQRNAENYARHIFGSSISIDWQRKHIHTEGKFYRSSERKQHPAFIPTAFALIGGCGLIYYLLKCKSKLQLGAASLDESIASFGIEIVGLPIYTSYDVASHDRMDRGVWVSYKSGVYDITQFVSKHPGGDAILLGAGGALEPFWEIYANHKTDQVLKLLEEYRIGNLSVSDRETATKGDAGDPYTNDPKRHASLRPASLKPFNAEPPLTLLVDSFITPNALFYVRNHLPVPEVDPKDYELEIGGPGFKTATLSLCDIKTKFPKTTVTTTVQCAGNRRSELIEVKEVKGLNWGAAAIGTAKWSGARLSDVLKYIGADVNDSRIKHVQFEGLDTDPAGVPYGASVPADKALDPKSDIILAYEMNGEELPRDHGFPVRAIIPGVVGARNVKWLGRIVLSEEESHSHWQRKDYKGFSPNVEFGNADFSSVPAIQELPVTSAICDPAPGSVARVKDGHIRTRGYAWSGGGRDIVRVDVSADGGHTWTTANLQCEGEAQTKTWAWTLWEVEMPLPKGYRKGQEMELICKAVDSSYNVQPDTVAPIWNCRGVLCNAWHRVRVKLP